MGYGAALLVIGGSLRRSPSGFCRRARRCPGFPSVRGLLMWRMEELTHNPLFPYFNDSSIRRWRCLRPIATNASCRVAWALGFPILFRSIALPLCLIATSASGSLMCWVSRPWPYGRSANARKTARRSPGLCHRRRVYGHGLVFLDEDFRDLSLHPVARDDRADVIALAVGILPLPRRTRLVAVGGILFFALLVPAPLGARPLGDPYIEAYAPHPDPSHT